MGCKETILDRMRTALSRVLVLPEEHESDEDLYDICRAYGLLLNVCSKSKAYDHQVSFTKVSDMDLAHIIHPPLVVDDVTQMTSGRWTFLFF